MKKYKHINGLISSIKKKYIDSPPTMYDKFLPTLEDLCLGYTSEELEIIENLVDKKIPESVKEWFRFAGNKSPILGDLCSFKKLMKIWKPDGSIHQGKYDNNIRKMNQEFLVFSVDAEDEEDYFDFDVVRYDEGDDPPVYSWSQYFDGTVVIEDQREEWKEARSFSEYLSIFV